MKTTVEKLKMRLPAIAALVITLVFWGAYERYVQVSDPLLERPGLSDAFRVRGDCSEDGGVFRLHVPEAGKTAEARFELAGDPDYTFLRLEGRIRTEDVVPGKRSWNSARLLLIQRDAAGRWISGKHRLLSKHGTVDWADQVQVFEIEPHAVSVEVVVQHTGTAGTAWFDGMVAVPVEVRGSYPWFRGAFCFLWVTMVLVYFKRCRLDGRKLRILILVNVFVILYGTMLPSSWIAESTEWVKKQLREQRVEHKKAADTSAESKPAAPNEKTVEKRVSIEQQLAGQLELWIAQAHRVGHFVLFASLCLLVYCSAALEGQGASYYLKVAGDLLLFAAISESLQYLTLDRTPGFHDWLMDLYGMVTAFGVFLFGRFWVRIFAKAGKA